MPQALAAIPSVLGAVFGANGIIAAAGTAVGLGVGLSGAAAVALGTAVSNIAVSAVISAGLNALAPKPEPTRAQLQTTTGGDGPVTQIMGRTVVAGHVLTPTPMMSGGSKKETANQVYALSGAGPCGLVESVWWGDDQVNFSASAPYSATGKYADAMWLSQQPGSWTQPRVYFRPTATPTEWTASHRALGCLVVAFAINGLKEVYASNTHQPLFVVDAHQVQVIDPRTGALATTTAQRRNPAVWAYSWWLGFYAPASVTPSGTDELIIGYGMPAANLDTGWFAAWAGHCDAMGWQIAGELSAANDNFVTLQAIMEAGGATFATRAGLMSGVYSAQSVPVTTITMSDLAGPVSIKSAVDSHELPTRIIPRFRDIGARGEFVEVTALQPAEWAPQGGQSERTMTRDWHYAASANQARQLSALEGYNTREPHQISLTCKPSKRYSCTQGDVVTLDLPGWGLTGYKARIARHTVTHDLISTLELVTETDSKYVKISAALGSAQAVTRVSPWDQTDVPEPDAGRWSATAATIASAEGSAFPIIRVSGSAVDYIRADRAIVQIRPSGATNWSDGQPIDISNPLDTYRLELRGLTPATQYDVQISYRNDHGVIGPARQLGPVTTGTITVPVSPADPTITGIQGEIDTQADQITAQIQRGTSLLPDPQFRDPSQWPNPAVVSGLTEAARVDLDGGWVRMRGLQLRGTDFGVGLPFFPVEPGMETVVAARIWRNGGGFTGALQALVHVPGVAFYGLHNGQAVHANNFTAPNAMVGAGDTGEVRFRLKNPTGVANNINAEWQLFFFGQGMTDAEAGRVLLSVDILQVPAAADIAYPDGTLVSALQPAVAGATANTGALADLDAVDLGNGALVTGSLPSLDRIVARDLALITNRAASLIPYSVGGSVEDLRPAEANADVTATAQRSIIPQFPVIEIKQGEAGHTGNRTVTHTALRGTATITGGTWSLPTVTLGAGSASINASTGTVTLSGIVQSGSYRIRYTHTDGIVTDHEVNVSYIPTVVAGTAFKVTANPTSVPGTGPALSTVTTDPAALTISNAVGTVSIFWEEVAGNAGATATVGSTNSSVSFEATPPSGASSSTMRGTAYDAGSGEVAFVQIIANFTGT